MSFAEGVNHALEQPLFSVKFVGIPRRGIPSDSKPIQPSADGLQFIFDRQRL